MSDERRIKRLEAENKRLRRELEELRKNHEWLTEHHRQHHDNPDVDRAPRTTVTE